MEEAIVLEDSTIAATFNQTSGLLSSLLDKATGVRVSLTQRFYYYTAKNSGPWMLRPTSGTQKRRSVSQIPQHSSLFTMIRVF